MKNKDAQAKAEAELEAARAELDRVSWRDREESDDYLRANKRVIRARPTQPRGRRCTRWRRSVRQRDTSFPSARSLAPTSF